MTGHWTYEDTGCELHGKDEMWEYIRDHEYYADDIDFERWVDDNYRASQIIWRVKEMKDAADAVLDLWDEFEEEVWYRNIDDPVEGEDFDYNGFIFKWVEEEEED